MKRSTAGAKRGAEVSPTFDSEVSLPAQRAFVIQLGREALPTADGVAGRVHHIVSGRSGHFASGDELFAFIARVLGRGEGR